MKQRFLILLLIMLLIAPSFAAIPNNRANFISRYRASALKIIEALEELDALKAEYDALGYSSSIVDGDFTGANADLTATPFKDALANLETFRASFFSSNFDDNVFKLRP